MKTFSLQNEAIAIKVEQEGAELCSLKKVDSDLEYIWQAKPKIWASHAPVLFPIIGMLKEAYFIYDDKKYYLNKHGLVRHNKNIEIKTKGENELVFQLNYSEETLKAYPFKFHFEIAFKLNGKTLEVAHHVKNLGDESMYFSLGGHPAFNVPLHEDEKYTDYFLQFDQEMELKSHLLNRTGLVSEDTKTVMKDTDSLQLTDKMFDNDALVFLDIPSKKVTLNSTKNGKILSLSYKDFKNLGLWAKPKGRFLCIEPWLGMADVMGTNQKIEEKEGIISLEAEKEFKAAYQIEIE